MGRDAVADRRSPGAPAAPYSRIAFSVWSAAFAVGVLFHEWQANQPWPAVGPFVVMAAVAVLLRPVAPVRLVVLFTLLFLELLTAMPDPWNHLLLVGVLGIAFAAWWVVLAVRDPAAAADPGVLYQRVGPYLRLAFLLSWVFAAFAKLNTGFLEVTATCAAWIVEGIPGMGLIGVPDVVRPTLIAVTIVLELAIPVLLFFHRTRPYAVVLGLGFHLISALGGHAAFAGLAWSFYLLFLPPAVLARAVVVARRTVPAGAADLGRRALRAGWLLPVAVGVVWVLAVGTNHYLVPEGLQGAVRRFGAAGAALVWLSAWALMLFTLRRHWWSAPGPRASLRVRNVILLLGLAILTLDALMPYAGLKTRAAFTMYSNLRTEPGHWNHLVMPEAMRVFDWQDGEVHFLGIDDEDLRADVRYEQAGRVVLADARRLVAAYPDATVTYRLDGATRVAAPVSEDPFLGAPPGAWQGFVGAFRPFRDGGTCQH